MMQIPVDEAKSGKGNERCNQPCDRKTLFENGNPADPNTFGGNGALIVAERKNKDGLYDLGHPEKEYEGEHFRVFGL